MKRARSTPESLSSPSNILSGEQRINKLLAAAGLGSRRQVDELIEQGRVEIDGVICDQLGMKVDAEVSKITVDGTPLKKFRPVYYALNKPSGVLCTNRDPQGRRRAIDFIPGHQRLFPVGRLDASSVGLLLLTNDGELTQQLTHPKHGVPKTYYVVVAGQMEPDEIRRLRRGIYLSDGVARVDFVKIRNIRKSSTELEITLSEGKNREIRRVLARIGHKVVTLQRLSIGPLKLGNMPEAAYRTLSKEEIIALYRAAEDARKARKTRKKENIARGQEIEESKAARAAKKGIESSSLSPKGELQDPPTKPAKSTTKSTTKTSRKSKTSKAPSAPRDPFAWDDDDQLLMASPFAPHHQSAASDEADDDDDGWVNDIEDDDQDDGFPEAGQMEGEVVLVDDRESMRVGGVLDYDDNDNKLKPPGRTRKKPTLNENQRSPKKSANRESRSHDRPRGSKRSSSQAARSSDRSQGSERTPRTGKKKFGSPKSAKKGGFKKGGFKKGGFKKGGVKKGGFNRGGRSSKGTPPKSSGRTKRRP